MQEPKWRVDFRYAIEVAKRTRNFALLEQSYQEHCVDGFDMLVQSVARGNSADAYAQLKKYYPGSVERQAEIDQMVRGAGDGV